jgi:hypothetical protein
MYFPEKEIHMATATHPQLRPGRAYRTRDLAAWSANAPRLAKRLVREGQLVPLAHGLFVHPRRGRFGDVPPTDEQVMRAFLDGGRFVFTGPERWNALGLGTTAMFAAPLVYNTKRSGTFELGGRRYVLRRVAFPDRPTPEWFVVDLFENAKSAGADPKGLASALRRAVAAGAFDGKRLRDLALRYGTRRTRAFVESALGASDS